MGEAAQIISIDGEAAVVQTTRAHQLFRSSCVKPYIRSELQLADNDEHPVANAVTTTPTGREFRRGTPGITQGIDGQR